ncbi:MAG: enoyl-CoA hydratase/isomerase family protein [Thermoprotei archaeon]|nr:enoyl-CoA hydratase/isomerase family protein [Thermoprotei archaeon]
MYRYVKVSVEEGVGWIVISRSEKLNALNSELLGELIKAVDEVEARGEVKIIVLTGEGKAFSAGADLSEPASAETPEEAGRVFRNLARLVKRLFNVEKPLIIALNGDAYGGGAELIWTADLVVAVENAKLVWPEARWGYNAPILAALGPSILGPSRTALLAMTAEPLTAKEAHHYGLIAKLAPDQESLREEVKRIAKAIMENSPQGIKSIKNALKLAKTSPLIELGVSELERLARGKEAMEAAKAFKSKKKPEYLW